jgi:hypothetical protein
MFSRYRYQKIYIHRLREKHRSWSKFFFLINWIPCCIIKMEHSDFWKRYRALLLLATWAGHQVEKIGASSQITLQRRFGDGKPHLPSTKLLLELSIPPALITMLHHSFCNCCQSAFYPSSLVCVIRS